MLSNMFNMSLQFDRFKPIKTLYVLDNGMDNQIQALLETYCFCQNSCETQASFPIYSTESPRNLVIKLPIRPIKARKHNRLLKSRNVQYSLNCLELIINNTLDRGEIVIRRSKKSRNSTKCDSSTRRSSYIGVSKNGDVWQSLIMIDSKKTYIGSYHTEEEAARSYDFYAIVLKHLSAKTNFDYNLSDIQSMVGNYYMNQRHYVVESRDFSAQ